MDYDQVVYFDKAIESKDVIDGVGDVTAYVAEDDRPVGELEVEEFLGDAAGVCACYCVVVKFCLGSSFCFCGLIMRG